MPYLLVGALGVGVWAFLAYLIVLTSASIHRGHVHSSPLRIGPSYLSLIELWEALRLHLAVLAGGILGLARHRQPLLKGQPPRPCRWVAPILLYFLLASLWTAGILVATEFAHKETIYAEQFTLEGWVKVELGMSHDDVRSLLGPPLPDELSLQPPGQASECWARNWSAGYFALVVFVEGRVTEKNLSYSD